MREWRAHWRHRQPGKAARQRSENEDRAERERLRESTPRTRFEIGAGGAGAEQSRLRINPLEGGHRQETRWFGSRFGIRSTGARDLPRQPEQERNADPFEDLQNLGIVEDEAAEPEGDDEHHDSHPDRDAQKGRNPADDADIGTGCGQQDIAWPRGTRRDNCENRKSDYLIEGYVLRLFNNNLMLCLSKHDRMDFKRTLRKSQGEVQLELAGHLVSATHDGNSFNLNQSVGIDETGTDNRCTGYIGVWEDFGSDLAVIRVVAHVRDITGDLHDIGEGRSGFRQHAFNIGEDLARLCHHVTDADDLSVGVLRDLTGDIKGLST